MNVGEHPGRIIFQHPHWGGRGADSEPLPPSIPACVCLITGCRPSCSPLTLQPRPASCLSFPSGLSYQQPVNLPARCGSAGAAGASSGEPGSLHVILLGKVLFHFHPAECAKRERLGLFVKDCNDFPPCLVWNHVRTGVWGNWT